MTSKFVKLRLGIKKNKFDGLLIKLPNVNKTEMITTKNRFAAAPVLLSRANIKSKKISYIFINSGNANACTGKQGKNNALKILSTLSKKLGCPHNEILIMSTGIIGQQLPIDRIIKSITSFDNNDYTSLREAASAIMTTDKFPKYITKTYRIGNKKFFFRGICKGAGMIEPNMATMLGFIETNVTLTKPYLRKCLRHCSNLSFNSISVDGDTSTNDTVVFSSCNEIKLDLQKKSIEEKFLSFAADFFIRLSSLIVKDGEGSTKIIKLCVRNSKTLSLAQQISKKVSNSLLVKTAMFGEDPNWGRIIASLGSIDSNYINPNNIRLSINNILCFRDGISFHRNMVKLKKSMRKSSIEIVIDLKNGKQNQTMYFSDLSYEYVRINSEYTS